MTLRDATLDFLLILACSLTFAFFPSSPIIGGFAWTVGLLTALRLAYVAVAHGLHKPRR